MIYVAPTAVVVGDVSIEDGASVWHGAVLRGDFDAIVLGRDSNVQDNVVVHVDRGMPATIGARVTVGHAAVVHGCTIEDDCLIGMNATINSGAVIGRGSLVASGAVVRERDRGSARESDRAGPRAPSPPDRDRMVHLYRTREAESPGEAASPRKSIEADRPRPLR